ncbi:secreted phosphoprotein 24 [Gopherus flavomarginatus]|uniref:secreted phosphoprotein 24 n=1 Tax=Gopherus flavomarginatus TaxID=286002 RepID=UPI0021CC3F64|nr:secreted phosphoprotein 24 [Gopherus flavomarginatus]
MKTLFVFALVMSVWSCSGLPVYDYEPSIAEEALRASIGRVNSRSQWPALFGVVRSYVRGVDLLDNNDYSIVLDFIVRETTCTKDSEKDPSLCDFRMGRYVQTAFCRSTVRVSEEQIQNFAVYCSQDGSSSESSSSEEMMFMEMMVPNRRGDSRNEAQLAPEAFSAGRRRQSYKAQRRSSKANSYTLK